MKLHLPITLLTAVLAAVIALPTQAVEAPKDYTTTYLNSPGTLENYSTLTSSERIAFILEDSQEITPTGADYWTSSTPLISGGHVFFGSYNSDSPVALSFKDGYGPAFYDQSALTFDTLSNLTFSTITGNSAAIRVRNGTLTITNVNDGQSDTVDVLFKDIENTYSYYSEGGAIDASTVTISNNGDVSFSRNSTTATSAYSYSEGGAIDASTVTISDNGDVSFSGNSAGIGGAIYADGGAVTISHNGDVTFSDNSASSSKYTCGGAIYADGGAVTISQNGDVTFSDNSAASSEYTCGGAIYATGGLNICNNGDITFTENSVYSNLPEVSLAPSGGAIYATGGLTISYNGDVSFSGNSATHETTDMDAYSSGGAIYATGGLTISYNRDVTFSGNSVSSCTNSHGGAICAGDVIISNNANVSFSGNSSSTIGSGESFFRSYGGAIYADDVTISNNANVSFSGNSSSADASSRGGAIYADDVTISNNANVTFSGNSSSANYSFVNNPSGGGAIYASTVTISNNGNVSFSGNSASSGGGAIYASTVTISNNGNVSFSGNSSSYNGGAIYADGGHTISLSGNRSLTFQDNTSSSFGGAIYSDDGKIIISDNDCVSFRRNSTGESGGAVGGHYSACTEISNNTYVEFCENSASYGAALYQRGLIAPTYIKVIENGDVIFSKNTTSMYGGAIFCGVGVQIILNDNKGLYFNDNTSTYGGAVYGDEDDIVNLIGNGEVSFVGNKAYSLGGAIGGYVNSTINLANNESVIFRMNSAPSGGAIHTEGNLHIQNNESVLFEKNVERAGDSYRLRSIHAGGGGDTVSLSASAEKSIEFRDSIYIANNTSFSLNADYVDEAGQTHKQTGDIIFTGATTEADLLAVKGSAGTAEEILASRTSEVYAMTNLCGGRLRIEDGAIYKGNGITVAEGANATLLLKDGELSHDGYDITISSGSTLSAVGENTITASTLAIQDGGTMHLALDMSQADSAAVLTTTGNLSMGNISFDLTGTEYLLTGEYKLLTRTEGVDYDISGWTLNGVTSEQLRWENGTLYYTANHDWNHGVTDDDDISDLEEIIGNLVINGGDITLDDVVQAIQDAVDAGFGHGQGHIVINRGGIHISGAGDLDGHIIFNGDLKDIRKLFIEKDITSIKIELGGSTEAENIVAVGEEYTVEIDELSGDGGMSKTGQGEMVVHGNGHKVGGTVAVQEGALTFTVGNQPAGGENPNSTEVHELVVGNDDDKDARVQVNEGAQVAGDKLHVNGKHSVVTNDGSMEFTEEVRVKGGRLNNNGAISRVTLEGGKVTGSGSFDGLEMLGGELVVGNSPGLQTYTDDVELTEGIVTFSLADAATAATADTYGWSAAAYSTIDMNGNALTIGADVRFALEIGGGALEALTASDDATLTFSLSLIQNIATESLTLNSEALAELLSNTSIIITSDAEGLTAGTLFLAGRDITSMLSNGEYSYEGNTLVFTGTVTNDGSLNVPEPTTATLSLLALAALASRRRRR